MSTSTVVEHPSDHRQSRPELPEPGRVVRMRGAIWAVTDVVQQGLPRSPADEGEPGHQHVVSQPGCPVGLRGAAPGDGAQAEDRAARANGRKGMDLVGLLLRKRFLSGPWAFARTLAAFAQATTTGTPPALTDEYYAEVLGSGQADEEEGRQEHPEFLSLWRGNLAPEARTPSTDGRTRRRSTPS